MCQYRVGLEQFLAWLHVTQFRRDGTLTDDDGMVEPSSG